MILHAFYNLEDIGDVLLIRLSNKRQVTRYEKVKDLCVLYHQDEVIGYNLFQASKYISDLSSYQVKITPEFVLELNTVLKEYNQKTVESDYDDHIKVGHVVEMEEHPDSDHMHICQVDVGDEVLQIVCGAPNVEKDQYVVVALENAVMPSGLVIKPSALRGVDSKGMLCSARELNLPHAPQKRGILVLNKAEYQVGQSFFK